MSGMHHDSRNQSGTTLIEVLVALVILAFVALGITTLLSISIKQNKLALERTTASGLASGRLNQLLAMPYTTADEFDRYRLPEEWAAGGPPMTLSTSFGEIPGYPDFRRTVTLEYENPVPGMLRVQVDVGWWSFAQGQEKTHTMITYVHPDLEEVD